MSARSLAICAAINLLLASHAFAQGGGTSKPTQPSPLAAAPASSLPPSTQANPSTQSVDERLNDVVKEQQYLRQAMRDNVEASRFLVTVFSYLLAAVVVAQFFRDLYFQKRQREREDELELRRVAREDEQDLKRHTREENLRNMWLTREREAEGTRVAREARLDAAAEHSTRGISNILNVLHRTLEARRRAEIQARRAEAGYQSTIDGLTQRIQELTGEITTLKTVATDVRRTRDNEQSSIVHAADELALVPRHSLRLHSKAFEQFAQNYDSFISRYPDVASSADGGFASVVHYVRGIAAHHSNDPETSTRLLTKVVGAADSNSNRKRMVVTYYFLGITESNFEAYDRADEYFVQALALEDAKRDDERRIDRQPDLLTRVAAAEASAMGGNAARAKKYLDAIDGFVAEMADECKASGEELATGLKRLSHRALLVRANLKINDGPDAYADALGLLDTLGDPREHSDGFDYTEYYAKVTLAQLIRMLRPGDTRSASLFQDAYSAIQGLGHLVPGNITETRSRALVLMTAGMAALLGRNDHSMAAEHFDEARRVLSSLPKRGERVCSVFSIASKRNESPLRIESHIKSIRGGTILLR